MIVITGSYGELCNRLFVYAAFIGFAAENGVTIANPAFGEYAPHFCGPAGNVFCRFPSRASPAAGSARLRGLVERAANKAVQMLSARNPRFLPVALLSIGWERAYDLNTEAFIQLARRQKLIFADGFLFSDAPDFLAHRDEIRAFFLPIKRHRENIDAFITKLRGQCDVLVGVHVRHGDYRTHLGGIYFYCVEEYSSVMTRVAALFPEKKVAFLVCSNETQPMETFSSLTAFPGLGHFVEDLYSLAKCDYVLGPPSTYTMWASFYGSVPRYELRDPAIAPSRDDFKLFFDADGS